MGLGAVNGRPPSGLGVLRWRFMVRLACAHTEAQELQHPALLRALGALPVATLVGGAAMVAAASACGEAFTSAGGGGAGGGGGGSTPTTTATGGSTGSGTTTGTSSGTSTGTDTGTATGTSSGTGGGGEGGGWQDCAHGPCDTGPPLDSQCHECLGDLCSSSTLESCCTKGWDSRCLAVAKDQCGTDCDVGDPPIACNDQYGATPGYWLCEQAEGACVFNVAPGMACAGRCQLAGGRCLNAWTGGQQCTYDENIGCLTAPLSGYQSCYCTVGCNGEQPCGAAAVCTTSGCSLQ